MNPVQPFSAGVLVNDSNNVSVHDNLFHDNAGAGVLFIYQTGHSGITGMADCVSPAPTSDTDTSNVLEHDSVTNNTVYSCASGPAAGLAYGTTEEIVSRNDTFDGNHYYVPSTTGSFWADPHPMSWAAWQGVGLDKSGSVATPCTYSSPPSCGN